MNDAKYLIVILTLCYFQETELKEFSLGDAVFYYLQALYSNRKRTFCERSLKSLFLEKSGINPNIPRNILYDISSISQSKLISKNLWERVGERKRYPSELRAKLPG